MKYYLCLAAVFALAACSNSNTPSSSSSPVTFTGKLTYDRAIAIPSNARLMVLWLLSPDKGDSNTYFEAAGTIDTASKTFAITLPNVPPMVAYFEQKYHLDDSLLAMGFVVLTTDPITDGFGSIEAHLPPGTVLGAINNTLLIYMKGELPQSSGFPGNWPSSFPQGYGFGVGHSPGNGQLDTIVHIDNSNLQLLIDTAQSAFHEPNWG